MVDYFLKGIGRALVEPIDWADAVTEVGAGSLPSLFDVSGLAAASIAAACLELGTLNAAVSRSTANVTIDRRLSSFWFGMSIRPIGWALPPPWDAVAGDYLARDGWIRLHTNAPHHRKAAMSVLACQETRDSVAAAVGGWEKAELERAIVESHGCAAAMHSLVEWEGTPQGKALREEPLIAWSEHSAGTGNTHRSLKDQLHGIRVLDLTRVLAGPVATRFLAGYGADVLRIDPPNWSEPGVEPEVTLGKRCAELDLRQETDRNTFMALVRYADVIIHGYRPDALERIGLGAEIRYRINPDIIDVSLSAYGWSGPWATRRGFDSLVQMSTGIAAEGMTRNSAEKPVPLPVQALDQATGYLMAAAAIRALRERRDAGRIWQARLSLARTARLLIEGGMAGNEIALAPEGPADLSPEVERTWWGPAQRVCFPADVNGIRPQWKSGARPVRSDPASWFEATDTHMNML